MARNLYKNMKTTSGDNIHIISENGRISSLHHTTPPLSAYDSATDLEGRVVLAGIIDPHVHLRDPGLCHKEDFLSGTKSAVVGGVTAVVDMPNTVPVVTTAPIFREKMIGVRHRSYCDYGLYFGGSSGDNSGEVAAAIKTGLAPYLKIFLNVSTGEMLVEDDVILGRLFEAGEKIFVHAEGAMVEKSIKLSRDHKKQLTICHVSTKDELAVIKEEKAWRRNHPEFPPLFAEVTPHHLTFTKEVRDRSPEADMLYRMKPELGTASDVEALWQGIVDGTIDVIGTDHAPHLLGEKLANITFGVPGLETSLAVMLTHFKRKSLPLPLLEKLMSRNVANMLALNGYGELKVGNRANFTVVDTDCSWTLSREQVISKCGWSPYEGMEFSAKNYMTVVGGETAYLNGNITNILTGAELF